MVILDARPNLSQQRLDISKAHAGTTLGGKWPEERESTFHSPRWGYMLSSEQEFNALQQVTEPDYDEVNHFL